MVDSSPTQQDGQGGQSEMPFLIAHVVRGEAAFDIAIKMQFGQTEGWLIPTSGHRAYPYWTRQLTEVLPDRPAEWPDHYALNSSPTAAPKAAASTPVGVAVTLEELGLDL